MGKTKNRIEKKESAIKNAKKETPFNAADLALEIEPLIRDYFVGDFELDGNKISCKFLNGQKFIITVGEVKE